MVKTTVTTENGEAVEVTVAMVIVERETSSTKQQEHGENHEEEHELGERGEGGDADGRLVEAVGEDEVECFLK